MALLRGLDAGEAHIKRGAQQEEIARRQQIGLASNVGDRHGRDGPQQKGDAEQQKQPVFHGVCRVSKLGLAAGAGRRRGVHLGRRVPRL